MKRMVLGSWIATRCHAPAGTMHAISLGSHRRLAATAVDQEVDVALERDAALVAVGVALLVPCGGVVEHDRI